MKSAMDAPDVAPGFTAVELLIPTWCTCWDKQSIIHDNLIVIKYLQYISIAIDLGIAKIKATQLCIQTLTAETEQFGC